MANKITSVVVVTYNSSETIIETLESIKIQDYRKYIEVVVSDDCSTDNTVDIIKDWFFRNELFLSSVVLIENIKNSGITKNFNKAIRSSSGEYIKILAGDDALLSISSIRTYIENIREKQIVFSPVAIFGCGDSIELSKHESYKFSNFLEMNERDKKGSVFANSVYSPKITGVFFRRQLLMNMGLFDENYPMMEDYPFIVKIFERHYEDIVFLNKQLYNYRVRGNFLENFFVSKRKIDHVRSLNKYRKKEALPLLFKNCYFNLFFTTCIKMILSNLEIKNIFLKI